MEITAVSLCDFAQVREGLLFISSGGISRIGRQPGVVATMNAFLATVVELDPDEAFQAHELQVKIKNTTTAAEVGTLTAGFQSTGAQLFPGENLLVPIVAPLHGAVLGEDGPYDIHVSVDSGTPRILTVYVFTGQPPA